MTIEEKKALNRERQKAVRDAWKNERHLVLEGRGTRNWNRNQQQEILTRGSVKGYDGHHMKSVSKYPQYAGNPKNIQFLTEKEHYNAHGGNYKSPTNGYYNTKTNKMVSFKGNELRNAPIHNLNSNVSHFLKKNKSEDAPKKQAKNSSNKVKCQNFRDSINNQQTKKNATQTNSHINKNSR